MKTIKQLSKLQLIDAVSDLFWYSWWDFDDMNKEDIINYLEEGQIEKVEEYTN